MSSISKPYTFSPNTSAASSEVNANFDTIYNDHNGGISAANLADSAVSTAKIAADAVTNAKIADAAIFPEQLVASTGTTWAWQTWSPTFTNVSGGTLNYAKYNQTGKTVNFRLKYTLAGAGVTGTIIFTSPTTMSSDYTTALTDTINSSVVYFDDAGVWYTGFAVWQSSTTIGLYNFSANATYTAYTGSTATIPFTWGAGDSFTATGTYEAA